MERFVSVILVFGYSNFKAESYGLGLVNTEDDVRTNSGPSPNACRLRGNATNASRRSWRSRSAQTS